MWNIDFKIIKNMGKEVKQNKHVKVEAKKMKQN